LFNVINQNNSAVLGNSVGN